MRVMVVGSGGREHAIVKKLSKSRRVTKLYALPGNGGIAEQAECVGISATDIDAITEFAVREHIDFAVVAPDNPLVMGAVDRLHAAGVRCFGPSAAAAATEGSKIYAKRLMEKYGIPTARCAVFDDALSAMKYLSTQRCPIVVKADGLALGKGVFIAETLGEAENAVQSLMSERVFGTSGDRIVIEECLRGPEVSVLAFTDGHTLVPMVSSMDHKRIGDGNTGPNTGGMGTIAPNPYYTPAIADECMKKIFIPTMNGLNAEGRPFKGCLYFGLMLTKDGPKVIEYNCRFGDPEAQVVLPLLETDLFEIMLAVEEERLAEIEVRSGVGAACCVVMSSEGYPGKYDTGFEIDMGGVESLPGVTVFHSGTKLDGGRLLTAGGRVLGVTAKGGTIDDAINKAYAATGCVSFKGAYYRRDIGRAHGGK